MADPFEYVNASASAINAAGQTTSGRTAAIIEDALSEPYGLRIHVDSSESSAAWRRRQRDPHPAKIV
jgi:hypothetical protein